MYAPEPSSGSQRREKSKITGKAAELAAILLRLPLDEDFFKPLEEELLRDGQLGVNNRRWVCDILRQIPLLVTQQELRERLQDQRTWYAEQLAEVEKVTATLAAQKTETTFISLLAGWRDPFLRRRLAPA